MTDLYIVLLEFLGKRSASTSEGINRVVDGNLAILMVQPGVDVFSALLENLLTKHDRGRGSINEEVVLWHVHFRAHGCSAVVTKMEDPSLDTQPAGISRIFRRFWRIVSYHCRYLERETEMWL
jgi:hypothetical protein